MPHQTEPNANNALAVVIRGMLPSCTVLPETTQVFPDHPGRHADVLIAAQGSSPVAVEAEYDPAPEVEQDARERLGLVVAHEPRPIEAAIAVRYPTDVESAYDLAQAISDAQLSFCVLYDDGSRFPQSGWLTGSVTDLADLIRLVSVPGKAVDAAAAALQQGIERAATLLNNMAELRPNITPVIARLLGMADVLQTRRMACAIIANALVFHQRIAGMYDGVKHLGLVCGPGVGNPQQETLSAWTDILKINYWPIFAIARDILDQLPAGDASLILAQLRDTAQEIDIAGVNNAHDLTGRIFQRLIADRKYLATFYTLPASAALLARLAVSKMDGVDWSDADAISQLRIADFACGTGALLSAVYEQVATRHERAGGDPAQLHPAMMEDVLYGCDVMPSAIHITSSTLSGAQPNIGFGQSRLYTMPYGRQSDGTAKIGSLELLQSSAVQTLFNTSDPALRTGSIGEETATQINVDIPDQGFDLVIMNPPFTRATNHEGAHADVTNPAFAAFDATPADQSAMGSRINELGKGTCYHGNAGIASAFVALADRKLKRGGILALVLPLSAAAGLSWQGFRRMLADEYGDLEVLSIAANGKDMSFSSDTGMAECLVVARKRGAGGVDQRIRFTSLAHRPRGFAEASAVGKHIAAGGSVRGIDDGPYGGTRLALGDVSTGEILTTPQSGDGGNWGSVRLLDYSLAQTAYALTRSELCLPGQPAPLALQTVPFGEVGKLGLVHRDITGPVPGGPFDKVPPSTTATYPALWNHDAEKETRLVCAPDSQLLVRQGMESKATEVWSTAGRLHLNLDFTFGSQPLAIAFTEYQSIGGRVWPNVVFADYRFDYAFAVWGNTTLGLLSHWWHSSRQQSSKAGLTIRMAESLPILDLRALADDQLATAETIFNEFRKLDLQPAYLADTDPNRALLDRRVVCDLLGFDENTYRAVRQLAAKWCAEPSVHGGKKRPQNSDLLLKGCGCELQVRLFDQSPVVNCERSTERGCNNAEIGSALWYLDRPEER